MDDLTVARAYFSEVVRRRGERRTHQRSEPCSCTPDNTVVFEGVAYCRLTHRPAHTCGGTLDTCGSYMETEMYYVCMFTGCILAPVFYTCAGHDENWVDADRAEVLENVSERIAERPVTRVSASTRVSRAPITNKRSARAGVRVFYDVEVIEVASKTIRDVVTAFAREHATTDDAVAWIRNVAREAAYWWCLLERDSAHPDNPLRTTAALKLDQLAFSIAVMCRNSFFGSDDAKRQREFGRLRATAQLIFPPPNRLARFAPRIGTCTTFIGRLQMYVRWRRCYQVTPD